MKENSDINTLNVDVDIKSTETLTDNNPMNIKNTLDSLLKRLKSIDFYKLGNFRQGEKISKQAYEIFTIEELLSTAGLCNKDLNIIDGEPFIFNGAYWMKIEESIFEKFLSKASLEIGVPQLMAKHHKFVPNLVRQFYLSTDIPDEYNTDSVKINCQNGTLHITQNGYEHKRFNKKDNLRYQLSFPYDKNAKCPKFQSFLDEVLPDKDCQKVLAEYLGYTFTKGFKCHKMLILLGQGDNGKSVIFDIINALFGDENIGSSSLSGLTEPKSYSRPRLVNLLLNYGSEMGGKVYDETFKQLVSGEKIETREIYGRVFDITNYAKLMYNSNYIPKNLLDTPSTRKRLLIIPFNNIIPPHKQDKHLADKIIKDELSGVLNWVLDGLIRLLNQNGFTDSEVINKTIAYLSKSVDTIALFLEERGYIPDIDGKSYKSELYQDYKKFCIEYGYNPENQINVRERLLNLNIHEDKDNKAMYYKLKRNR